MLEQNGLVLAPEFDRLSRCRRASRISDLDLRGYRGEKPGWLVQRICCMSLAAEIRRMTLDLEPAFDGVRRLLEALQDASKLVGDCPQGHADAWISWLS